LIGGIIEDLSAGRIYQQGPIRQGQNGRQRNTGRFEAAGQTMN